jgi:iron complex outermembrane recepter protein
MKRYFILLIYIALADFAFSQNILKGHITDQDKIPLPGTGIFIYELDKGTVADSNGNYILENIPDGKFRIQYSFIGYSSEVKTIFFAGKPQIVDVVMAETSIETREVVISGGYNSTQHENAVNIDRLKLQSTANILTPNTSELLTMVPGVTMISKGPGVSKPVIRGLSMDNVLVLNNGVRNENYQYSDHHPLGIDEFGVSDVEIIKGPASLLYGPDAIGGVVNFIREKPAPVGQILGDYNIRLFSNTLGLSTNLGLRGTSKKFYGGFRIGTKTHADYLQGGGDFAPNTRFNTLSLKADGGYTGKKVASKMYYEFNRQKLGLSEEEAIEAIHSRGRENDIWYEQTDNQLISSQNKIFLNTYKLEINGAFQSATLTHFAGPGETEISMRLSTLTYEAKLYLPSTEKSEYIVGVQGFNQGNKNIPGAEEILLPDATTDNYGLFTLLQHYFFKGFKVQAGLRYDIKSINTQQVGFPEEDGYRAALDKNYGSLSGSVGATYELRDRIFFRGNFAAAYRTPNLAELTSNGMHENRYEVGNSDLTPQHAYETDASIHYHIENLTFDIAGFYNVINHYIYIAPNGDSTGSGAGIYRYTQNDAGLFGGEAGIHLHPESWKWLHFETTFSTVTGKQADGEYLPFIPASRLDAELKFEKEKMGKIRDAFVKVMSRNTFRQDHPAPEENATDGYNLADIGLGFSLPISTQQIIIQFEVNNLFDKKYIDHLSTLNEVGLYDPGRDFKLSLSVPFRVR